MGHKAHPIGLRLGIYRKWNSNWIFESKNYTKFLHINLNIEAFLKGFLYFLKTKKTLILNTQLVKLTTNQIFIFVFFYRFRKKWKRNFFLKKKEDSWKQNVEKNLNQITEIYRNTFLIRYKNYFLKYFLKNQLFKISFFFSFLKRKNQLVSYIKQFLNIKKIIFIFKNFKFLIKYPFSFFFFKKLKCKFQLLNLHVKKIVFELKNRYKQIFDYKNYFIIIIKKTWYNFLSYKKKNFSKENLKLNKKIAFKMFIQNLFKIFKLGSVSINYYKNFCIKKQFFLKKIIKNHLKFLKIIEKKNKKLKQMRFKFILNKKIKTLNLFIFKKTLKTLKFFNNSKRKKIILQLQHPIIKIKKFLSKITNSKFNLIFINSLSFAKFYYLIDNFKNQEGRFNILQLQRMMLNKYKYHAIFIKDFINIAFLTILLKNPKALVLFIAEQFKRLPKNRKQLKLLKFLNQSIQILCKQRREIVGFKFQIVGRLNRRRRTHQWTFQKGILSLQTYKNYVEYGYSEGFTRRGLIGIHFWIFYSKNFILSFRKKLLKYICYSKYKNFINSKLLLQKPLAFNRASHLNQINVKTKPKKI